MKTITVRPGLTRVVRDDWPIHYRAISMPPERPTACGEARGDWASTLASVTCAACLRAINANRSLWGIPTD